MTPYYGTCPLCGGKLILRDTWYGLSCERAPKPQWKYRSHYQRWKAGNHNYVAAWDEDASVAVSLGQITLIFHPGEPEMHLVIDNPTEPDAPTNIPSTLPRIPITSIDDMRQQLNILLSFQ